MSHTPEELAEIKTLFDSIDTNKNEAIDREEFAAYVKLSKPEATEAYI